MRRIKKVIAIALCVVLLCTSAVIAANAVTTSDKAQTVAAATGITVNYKAKGSAAPNIYYWNSLPQNIETNYPGPTMTPNTDKGDKWYTYTFPSNITKVNLMFVENGVQSKELTRSAAGVYWYNDGWVREPGVLDEAIDMREDSVYFVITTRFFDGNTGNNVFCWDHKTANNPDSDPEWRGDFQGLIDKLDYIKALGFSAIWITPVVTNASGYDYHGYHAFDFSTVDVRYESPGATYQDLIDAVHGKGMKIIQDIVWNHNGNFGEAFLMPMFEKRYNTVQDLANIETSMIPRAEMGWGTEEDYYKLLPGVQFNNRLDKMKNMSKSPNNDPNNFYHHNEWQYASDDDWGCQYKQIAGDCVDINTENPTVANYLVDCYKQYIDMGVDSFRLDTERHISRLSLNKMYFPQILQSAKQGFYLFGEVCTLYSSVWFHEHPYTSAPFYTWKETADYGNFSSTDDKVNMATILNHNNKNDDISKQPTSQNAFLNGNDYHTPDYSQANGTHVIDFTMHHQFASASSAFGTALSNDKYYNDATYSLCYVSSHDYSPNNGPLRSIFTGGTDTWAENLSLLFTFRGVPCLYYGSEIEFMKGAPIDEGNTCPLGTTGRAYFGTNIEGNVTATDFSKYTASGKVAETLASPLSKHLTRLNQIRRAVPALQKGQYSVQGVSGDMSYKRAYTDPTTGAKSFVCVAVTNGATFTGVPNGTYIDAVTGNTQNVSNGTLTIASSGKGNLRAYVLSSNGYTGISGKIGTDGAYLK